MAEIVRHGRHNRAAPGCSLGLGPRMRHTVAPAAQDGLSGNGSLGPRLPFPDNNDSDFLLLYMKDGWTEFLISRLIVTVGMDSGR